jgi:hypothetical protein
MPVGYRSIFTISRDQDAVSVSVDQFRSWLRRKGYDPDAATPGMHEVGEHAQLVVTELHSQDGSRSLRYRLTETPSTGEWVTTITARQNDREEGWVWVDVNAPPSSFGQTLSRNSADEPIDSLDARWTAVPRLVRDILSVADARDGEMVLAGRPTLVTADEVDALISAICDPRWRGAALVAAPIPDVAIPRLIDHVEQLTRECVGLAGIYMLNTDAAAELEASFGRSHAVPLGAIRSFLPGADPASNVDGRRHRILLARTIATQTSGRLAHMLGRASRSRAMTLPLPAHVSRVDRLLSRQEPADVLRSIQTAAAGALTSRSGIPEQAFTGDAETRFVVREAEQIAAEAIREADAAASEAERTTEATGSAPIEEAATAAAREVTAASEVLAGLVSEFASGIFDEAGVSSVTSLVDRVRDLLSEGRGALRGNREMSRRITALQDSVEEVEDDRDQVRARLEEEQLDHAETQSELLDSKAEADRLRAALARVGRADEAWTVVAAAPQPPGSFAELLERLDEGALPGVVFTGEIKNVLELDEYDPLGTWASKAWDMLRVLDGYADARRAGVFTQGVHAYLSQTPPGRPSYSPGSHASQESESVQQSSKFSKLRTLPVPPEVDPDGLVFMGAHFKIARKGTISPRIYYYDSTAKTGEVFIGYIGRHLQNTLTN